MKTRWALIGASAAVLSGCAQIAVGPPPPGLYSNVHYIPEAGDYIGTELEIVGDGEERLVNYQSCEGWCYGAKPFPATVQGNALAFTFRQPMVNQRGEPSEPMVYRVVVLWHRTLLGDRVTVILPDAKDVPAETLRPVGPQR